MKWMEKIVARVRIIDTGGLNPKEATSELHRTVIAWSRNPIKVLVIFSSSMQDDMDILLSGLWICHQGLNVSADVEIRSSSFLFLIYGCHCLDTDENADRRLHRASGVCRISSQEASGKVDCGSLISGAFRLKWPVRRVSVQGLGFVRQHPVVWNLTLPFMLKGWRTNQPFLDCSPGTTEIQGSMA